MGVGEAACGMLDSAIRSVGKSSTAEARPTCTGKVLMSVDMYAICPCGNGKRIKFCKCKDSVGELDRVMKMVEGGQVVPALDRLSNILREHPDAAWAMAIRGRLLLDLREYDSLVENADRFIRLQPSNPLALTQRAAAQLFRGQLEVAVESILEALTESGREIDAFVLDVASVLSVSLARAGVFLTARVYASMTMMASGYQGGQTATQVLRQLNGSAGVSQLLKSIPELIERPEEADWGERYDEAVGLLRSNKVLLAQSKFESLRRVAGGEPAVLTGLLMCAIWRGDAESQSEFLRLLSACDSLDLEQRHRFRAMAALVQPGTPEIMVETIDLYADVDDIEQVEMALTAESRFVPIPREMLEGMKVSEGDVPPRAGFQLLDRDPPPLETLPPADAIPEALAMLMLYGRQTDRAARIEMHDVQRRDLDKVRQQLTPILAGAELQEEAEPAAPLPLIAACSPPMAMLRFQGKRADAESLQAEVASARTPATIVALPLPLLGGRSLAELAEDDSKRFERTVVMRILEHYDAIANRGEAVLPKVFELAKLEPLPEILLGDDQVETVANEDLNRIDPQNLQGESLIYLLQRAQQISATPAARRFAEALLRANLSETEEPSRLLAYLSLIHTSTQLVETLRWLEQGKEFCERHNMPMSELLLTEVDLRLQLGDAEGFQSAVSSVTQRYGNDPEVMSHLQQMLIGYGLLRPDGSPRTEGRSPGAVPGPGVGSEASPSPGLWTPDAPTQPPSQGGGSKLWVPGMD